MMQLIFERIKTTVTTTPVLKYFDPAEEVTVQSDKSQQLGLGEALMQKGQPVAYTSRALTETEKNINYAQIEKELLSIVFGVENFTHIHMEGHAVNVETDHKPLKTTYHN